MASEEIKGEERVVVVGGKLFGAPIAYIAIWGAIIAVAGMIPFSVIVGGGGSFAMSSTLLGLVAIALGPLAGALAVLIGAIIDLVIAPYSPFGPIAPIIPTIAALVAGLAISEKKTYRLIALGIAIVELIVFWIAVAIGTGASFDKIILIGSTAELPAIILFAVTLPFINKWIKSDNPLYLTLAVFIISYFATSSIEHCTGSVLWQILFGLPIDIWIFVFFAFAWWECLTIAIIGTIIGVPVIIALRKSALMKPDYAAY